MIAGWGSATERREGHELVEALIGPANARDWLPRVDAAAILNLPSNLSSVAGTSRDEIVHGWFGDAPFVSELIETPLGRLAKLTIPVFGDELYRHQGLPDRVRRAVELAGSLGARCVTLMGVVASALDYGRRVDLSGLSVSLSTGHATTSAAMTMVLRSALGVVGRDLGREALGVLGLGSIGISTLRTVMATSTTSSRPERLVLCDVLNKRDAVAAVLDELRSEFGYRGDVVHVTSGAELPRELYEATAIIGCTNIPNVLDVARLRPGTVLVDDSVPHCFRVEDAVARAGRQRDIVFLTAGELLAPEPVHRKLFLPPELFAMVRANHWSLPRDEPRTITSCVLSALLSSRFDELVPVTTLGASAELCVANARKLAELGYSAPTIRCDDHSPTGEFLADFAARYGDPGPRLAGTGRGRQS